MEKFIQAYKKGDIYTLEELADMAGYKDRLNLYSTELMQMCGEQWDIYYKFMIKYSDKSKSEIDRALEMMDTPRAEWNTNYENLFTRVKTDSLGERVVDCWRNKESKKLAIVSGVFPKKGDGNYVEKGFNEETNKLFYLWDIRLKSEPSSFMKYIEGTSLKNFFANRMFDASIFAISYFSTESVIASSLSLGVIQLYFYSYKKAINRHYLEKIKASVDEDAIKKIASEIKVLE